MSPQNGDAFQGHYAEDVAYCNDRGRLNPHGHHVRTLWEAEETVTPFTPEPHHTAIPGYVNGGLIASLVDCHGTGTAAVAGLAEGLAGRSAGQLVGRPSLQP